MPKPPRRPEGQPQTGNSEKSKKPLEYSRIAAQLRRVTGGLLKYDRDSLNRELDKLNLPSEIYEKLLHPGRPEFHLMRLLGRSPTERDFAIAFIKHADLIRPYTSPEKEKAVLVIGSEGYDTTAFWTFAPYVFKALRSRNINEEKAIQLIVGWAAQGASLETEDEDEDEKSSQVNLHGLEYMDQSYNLSHDPEHISHRFTAQEAEKVADILLAEHKK